MKEIPLTQAQVALVDDEDYDELNKYKWYTVWIPSSHTFYAQRRSGKSKVYMHRIILNAPRDMECDHVDGNGLNNQRANLRLCTRSENGRNSRKHSDNISGYKGASWHSASKSWLARITINNKLIHIGSYSTAEDAAHAYDMAAKELHGKFARINFGGK